MMYPNDAKFPCKFEGAKHLLALLKRRNSKELGYAFFKGGRDILTGLID
jgi:hypothetical protein